MGRRVRYGIGFFDLRYRRDWLIEALIISGGRTTLIVGRRSRGALPGRTRAHKMSLAEQEVIVVVWVTVDLRGTQELNNQAAASAVTPSAMPVSNPCFPEEASGRYRLRVPAMRTITKKELIDRIADRTGNKRVVVKRIIQTFLDDIVDELGSGNRLEFRDFGVFECKIRAARIAQNPKTLERVEVAEKRTVKFKIGRVMKMKLTGASAADGRASLRIPTSD